jgi:hypothetical protein
MNAGLNATYHYALVINGDVPAILYAGTDNGVFKTTDGGSSWSAVNSGLTTSSENDFVALTIDRESPAAVYGHGVSRNVRARLE